MNFTENERLWCIKIIKDLYKWKITQFFQTKRSIDEFLNIRENNNDDLIYLDLVRDKLYGDKYENINSFVDELKKIWLDIKKISENNDIYFVHKVVSSEILMWIEEQEKNKFKSDDEAWFTKLEKYMSRFNDHINQKPEGFAPKQK